MRRFVLRPAIWGLLLVAVLVGGSLLFLGSRLARERAAVLLTTTLSRATQRPVTVGSIDFGIPPLTFDVHDLVIPGPHPGDRPLVRVPFARVQLGWRALFDNVIQIDQVDLERPAFYLEVNDDGETNLPHFAKSEGGKSRFENVIGRILIQNGTFRLNETEVPLTVDAKAVWGRLAETSKKHYQVMVTAQEVVTALPDAKPYALTLSARGVLQPGGIRIENAWARNPELSGRAQGDIVWGDAAKVDLQIAASGQLSTLNRLGYLAPPIAGTFTADSRYAWNRGRSWSYAGKLHAPRIALVGREVEALETAFSVNRERLRFDVASARYHGGTAAGAVTVEIANRPPRGSGRPIDVDLTVKDVSAQSYLAEQFPEQFARPVPLVRVAAAGSGPLRYRFLSSQALDGSGSADLRFVSTAGREPGLPLEGELPLKLERGVLSSGPFHLTAPGQAIDGTFSFDLVHGGGQVGYRLASDDLGRLGPVWPPPPAGVKPDFWWPTAGRGTAEGKVDIQGSRYAALIGLDLTQVVTPAMAADRLEGRLTLSADALSDLALKVTRGPGTLDVAGGVRFPPAGKAGPSGLQLAVDASRFPLAAAAYFLPDGLGLGESQGLATGHVDLGGDSARTTGRTRFTVEGFALPSFPSGVALASLQGDLTFDGDRVTVERGVAETPAGVLLVRGSLSQGNPDDGALDLTLDAPALSLAAEPLKSLVPSDLAGELSVQAAVTGTLAHPAARAVLAARRLTLSGTPVGKGTAQAEAVWDGAQLTASGRLAELLTFEGGGALDFKKAALRFDVRSADLGGLVNLALPRPLTGLAGELRGTVEATADLAAGTSDVHLRLADLRGEYSGRKLVNLEPVEVHLLGRELSIERFSIGEPGGDSKLVARGKIGLPGPGQPGPLDLTLDSTLPLTWAKLALPDLDIGGILDLHASVLGTFAAPRVEGEGTLRQGRLAAAGFVLSGMTANLSFDPEGRQIVLDRLAGNLGGGALQARGWLDLETLPDHPAYHLTADLSGVGFPLYGFNLRTTGQGSRLVLDSTDGGRRLSGNIELERASYAQPIEEVNVLKVIRKAFFERPRRAVGATNALLTSTQLSLAVHGEEVLGIHNNLADLKGSIDLSVTGTLALPIPSGKIQLDPGGKIRYFDNEYRVDRGSLTFNNAYRIDPVIDLAVHTKVQSYNLSVGIFGTLERLDTRFSSDANLPDLEILSLLTTGTRPTQDPLSPLDTGPQEADQQAARSILQGQISSALSRRFGTLLGFDRFRIEPLSAENGQASSGIAYTVGKRLSKTVFVTYTRDPASTRRSVFQLEWQVGRGVTVLLTQTDQGQQSYSVDIQWEKRF